MKCRLITVMILIATLARATSPVVDPATLFAGWPWISEVGKPWPAIDTDKHIIKQIHYSLKDRCEAVGLLDMPYFETPMILDAGIKTNYVYQNWAYWTPETNIFANTNQVLTNYNPHIQVYIETNVINQIAPFTNYYPANPGVSGGGLSNNLAYVYVSRAMLNSWYGAVQAALMRYVPAAIDFDSYGAETNPLLSRAELPVYIFGQLLIDAGVGTVLSNEYDGSGILTNCFWTWTNALPGWRSSSATDDVSMATDGSNAVITLQGLSDVAAMVAQLRTVAIPGYSTAPACVRGYNGLNWPVTLPEWINPTVGDGYPMSFDPVFSFAWAASSTDNTWYTDFTLSNGWATYNYDNPPPDDRIDIPWSVTNHSDWTVSGWRSVVYFDFTVVNHRDTLAQSNWLFRAFGKVSPQVTGTGDMNWSGTGQVGIDETPTGGRTYGTTLGQSDASSTQFWVQYSGGENVYKDVISNATIDASTYSNAYKIVHSVLTNETPAGNYDIVTKGRYFSHTAGVDGVLQPSYSVQLEWTNTEYFPARPNTYTDVSSLLYHGTTNHNIYGTQVTYSVLDHYAETNEYQLSNTNQPQSMTNYSATATPTDGANYVRWQANIYSIRTDISTLFTNLTGKAALFVRGCNAGKFDIHHPAGGSGDWNTFHFNFTNINERQLVSGSFTNRIYTDRFVKIKEWSDVNAAVNTDPFGSYLLYRDMYDNAQTYGYEPFSEFAPDKLSREFWGIGTATFMVQYAFTNRF